MSKYHAAIADAGVDYLTLTATAAHNQAALWGHGDVFMGSVAEPTKQTPKSAEVMGYRGWQLEGVFVGTRDDSVMLRASSGRAHELWRYMLQQERCFNVRRIDIQVTGKFDADHEGYGREVEAQALAHREAQKSGTHGRIETHRGNGRGDTCTIGSRSSNRYLRCYDKTREQRNEVEPGLWRWEVEYKAELAVKAHDTLVLQSGRLPAIIGLVASEFTRKGVLPPWRTSEVVRVPTVGLEKTDDERRLRWLIMQVKPVVSRLTNVYGQNVILAALGLDVMDNDESA